MDRPHLVIIGAGLCGSILAARLRDRFAVTVVEPHRSARPLFNEIECSAGGVNSSINRGSGLGGTTNYWHNALVELDHGDLAAAGLDPAGMRPWYDAAWRMFLDDDQLREVRGVAAHQREAALATALQGSLAHMAVPTRRVNAWHLADERFPGSPIRMINARASRVRRDGDGIIVELEPGAEVTELRADRVVIAAGGLGTPVLLARSLERFDSVCGGYHDHPMAYVAKIRLRPDSGLRELSGV
ncbi:MAG TPA: hypothetical protein PLL69_10050, partial [Gemmatimonadales bacterium]|nr:hypothetical protein [Gemmatimonadales bacterium]